MTITEPLVEPTTLATGVSRVRDDLPDAVSAADDRPRAIHSRTVDDWLCLAGAAGSSLALVWLVYENILPFSGVLGFVLVWFVCFVAIYAAVTAVSQPWPVVADRVASAMVQGAAGAVGIALLTTLAFTFGKGWPALHHINFYTHDMSGVGTQDSLDHGGILHALVGSLIEVTIAVVISLPLGLATAVYMTEVGGRFARIVRTVIEAMTALPDLIAGLFVYAVLIIALGQSRTGLAAAIALSVTMLPIIARSGEVQLRVVPSGLREASEALGASQWRTVWSVVLPTARSGLGTSLILGVARGIGETAPLLIVSGASTYFNANPFTDPMNSLPLFVYSAVRSGEPLYITRGYGAASVLLLIVLILFIVVRFLSRERRGR